MSLTSEQVNAIVFRYLQESGFRHSSFAFQYESQMDHSTYRDATIPPGMLINVIHKGLQFMDIETHMNDDGELVECNAPFTLLGQHECELTGNTYREQRFSPAPTAMTAPASKNKRQRKDDASQDKKEREKRAKKEEDASSSSISAAAAVKQEEPEPSSSSSPAAVAGSTTTTTTASTTNGHTVKEDSTAGGEDARMAIDDNDHKTNDKVPKFDPSDVVTLTGHQSEVFSCAWNPVVANLLVSGSGDATARLWKVDKANAIESIVLNHLANDTESKDVTTLDWNPSGTQLASGSYDGQARIWTQKGELIHEMAQHRGPIFSLKWNRSGDLLLSGSADTTTVVWNPTTGEMKQQFEFHSSAILDVDWMDNVTFASCSSDKMIYVCRVGSSEPIKRWTAHDDEINSIRWDPTGEYLASCSDDMTTKIWSLRSDEPIQVIRGHQLQIYTLQWAPVVKDASKRILATGSFDSTIRLWDALSGECLHVLKNHNEAVYSISFTPNAEQLASGSFDEMLNIWNTSTGALQKTYKADGGIFEVHFNKDGSKLAACTSNKQVVILDLK